MTLQLANRSRDYYLYEIDRLSSTLTNNIDTLSSTITSDIDTKLDTFKTAINGQVDSIEQIADDQKSAFQVNKKFTDGAKHFKDDVVCYYDFSDPDNLGRDRSGNNRHGINDSGVIHSAERTHSAQFDRIEHASDVASYSTVRHINMNAHVDHVKLSTYSVSFWYKPTHTKQGSVVSFCNSLATTSEGTYFQLRPNNATMRILYVVNGTSRISANIPQTMNQWTLITFTNDSTGHKIYANGVLQTITYVLGDDTINVDLLTMNPNTFTIGALAGTVGHVSYDLGQRYRYGYGGLISDVMIHNRVLTLTEIGLLHADVYGWDVIVIAGQSNAVGRAAIVTGIDDDYSLHNGKVNQYETKNNISGTAPYGYIGDGDTESVATGNLLHPDAAVAPNCGPWKTFIDDYIRYSNMPFRKSILVVPVATGGTSLATHWKVNTGQNYLIAQKALQKITDPIEEWSGFRKITAFLWVHGETDCTALNLNYKTDFYNMYNGFKSTVEGFDDSVAILITEMSGQYDDVVATSVTPNVPMKKFINEKFTELAAENDNMIVVKTRDLTFAADYIHHTIGSSRTVGHRCFDGFMTLTKQSNPKPLTISSVQNVIVQSDMYLQNATVKDINVQSNLYLQPNTTSAWSNLALTSLSSKSYTLNLSGVVVPSDPMTMHVIKLNDIVFVTIAPFSFTIGATAIRPTITAEQIDPLIYPKYTGFYAYAPTDVVPGCLQFRCGDTGLITITDSSGAAPELTPSTTYNIKPFTYSYICA